MFKYKMESTIVNNRTKSLHFHMEAKYHWTHFCKIHFCGTLLRNKEMLCISKKKLSSIVLDEKLLNQYFLQFGYLQKKEILSWRFFKWRLIKLWRENYEKSNSLLQHIRYELFDRTLMKCYEKIVPQRRDSEQ